MNNSVIFNKSELAGEKLNEAYVLLKKRYDTLFYNLNAKKQDLADIRRSYQTALGVESQLNADLETYHIEEEKRKKELLSRVAILQEKKASLKLESAEVNEQNNVEIKKLEQENSLLREDKPVAFYQLPKCDTKEIDEIRNKLSSATTDSVVAKATLEESKCEISSWQSKIEELVLEITELRAGTDICREEKHEAKEREAFALAELAAAKAMLHQVHSIDLEPHATKGNSVFAEVEDKRQDMAKNLIQMKQTNARLRRDLANKQAEAEALIHEKQTIWIQQAGATSEYDRELIESYEDRIAKLEAKCENQWSEINQGLSKLCEFSYWQPGIIVHLKSGTTSR
ncbi:protein Spindly isoform X2 [Pieris rapae]|uniref:protein Spindly isoform X2 n=1 Tax=Pieris rapae TaxID=64459 RepID=UPI001E27DFB1|nr:protein Spindly isoform X2 [Pieris rapae]